MKHILILLLVAFTIQAHSQVDTVYNADSSSYYLLQHINTDAVIINIPPVKIGNSIIMRKAQVHAMIFNQKSKAVSVSCEILCYAFEGSNFTDTSYADNSNYGSRIASIPIRGIEIVATNSTLVNPLTGAIIRGDITGTVVGQYDFFFSVANYMPIKVNELITQYLSANTEW